METYQIIWSEDEINGFLDWIPELGENQVLLLSLMARKKYHQQLIKSNDKAQLKRLTTNKDRFIQKLRTLEVPLGRYLLSEIEAPQEALVAYVSVNPKCQLKAAKTLCKRLLDIIFDQAKGFNVQSEALSALQKSKAVSNFVVFDVDDENIDLTKIYEVFPKPICKDVVRVIQTRGGCHILVKVEAIKQIHLSPQSLLISKQWYKQLESKFKVDQAAKPDFSPIPGTIQGGHKVRMLTPIINF